MNYTYRVRGRDGKIVKGTLEADNRNLVIDALLRQQYTILEIKEDKDKEATQKNALNFSWFEKVTINDLSYSPGNCLPW